MPKASTSSGGNAKIKKQGHTTNKAFGNDPHPTRKYPKSTSDLNK